MSGLDDDFDALLSQAEVKEDFIDCGSDLVAPEPPSTPVQQDGSFGVVKSEEDKRRGSAAQALPPRALSICLWLECVGMAPYQF